jgi:imidazolonepropionase-like amidohydrolase
LREKTGLPLDTHLSVYMLDSADARSSAYLTRRVIDLVDSGAEWIKLMVTGGVGTPSEEVLDPHFSQEEIELVIRTAHEKGAKVMAHVWGGIGLDWLIQAGVDSVEHGVYISDIQAQALAASGAFLVPTAAIYRLIAEGLVGNNRELQRRAALAAEAHPRSIYRAREAGVPLVLGTDYGSPKEHGQNLKEIDALTSCGLSREEAWTAATLTGAALLGRSGQIGAVKPGHRADIIVFTGDPHRADAETLGVAGVIAAGKLVRTTAALDRCIRPLGLSDHSYS